jgi:predicted PurR-regulated permease PerM
VSPNKPAGKSSAAARLALLYFAAATAALVWPLYPWLGNRIEPRVLSLPFSLVWILVIISSNFCVLVLLYRLRLIDDLEVDESEPSRSGRGQQ